MLVSVVRKRITALVHGTGKGTLTKLLEENYTAICTAPFLGETQLRLLEIDLPASRIMLVGSDTYSKLVEEKRNSYLSKTQKNIKLFDRKLDMLAKIIICFTHVKHAPKGLQTVECIKWFIIDLIFDVYLFFLKKRGHDFTKNASSFFIYSDSHNNCQIQPIVDPSHVIKRICVNMTLGDFQGADSNNWSDLANSNTCTFNVHWYDRDIQNVPLTLEFISEETENALFSRKHEKSALFCKMTRFLWLIYDSVRVPVDEKLAMLELVRKYFYKSFYAFYYFPTEHNNSEVLESIPVPLAEAITILIDGYAYLHHDLTITRQICWNCRFTSTNDVENFFSTLKSIIGRDGRGLRLVSAVEIGHGLAKAIYVILERLNANRGYEIPLNKRRSYHEHLPLRVPRHVREQRNVPKNALVRAAKGHEVVPAVREYFR